MEMMDCVYQELVWHLQIEQQSPPMNDSLPTLECSISLIKPYEVQPIAQDSF